MRMQQRLTNELKSFFRSHGISNFKLEEATVQTKTEGDTKETNLAFIVQQLTFEELPDLKAVVFLEVNSLSSAIEEMEQSEVRGVILEIQSSSRIDSAKLKTFEQHFHAFLVEIRQLLIEIISKELIS